MCVIQALLWGVARARWAFLEPVVERTHVLVMNYPGLELENYFTDKWLAPLEPPNPSQY